MKRWNRLRNDSGVSEIIGTMLLLIIVVSLFSVVYFYVLTLPASPPTPSVNIIGWVVEVDGENEVILKHYGGTSLSDETMVYLTIDGEREESYYYISSYLIDENGNNKWDVGELVNISIPSDFKKVHVTIVDVWSNSVVMMGVIYEEE